MPDCVIKIDGVDYVPVRAIPAVTANRFDPLAATQLLGGDEPLVFARSYYVEPFGLVPPAAWNAPKDTQRLLRQEGASYIDKIKALPARIVVPLDDLAKAIFDAFIEPNLTWTAPEDLLLSNPGFLKGPIPQPIMEGFIYDLVMEGAQPTSVPAPVPVASDTAKLKGARTKIAVDQGWMAMAREIAERLHKEKPAFSVEQLAEKTHKEMSDRKKKGEQGMTGRGGKLPSAETIKRHALTGIKS